MATTACPRILWNALKMMSPTAKYPKTILLVDDQDESRITTKWFLGSWGYVVETARSGEEALARFDSTTHDLILTDNSMPGMSGAEMAHIIKLRSPLTPVLMCTGLPPEDRTCLDYVIQKPVHLLAVKDAVDKLLVLSPPQS